MSRRSLKLPVTLAIFMIVLLVLVIVGYVVLPVSSGAVYWTLLILGLVFLAMVLVGVIVYLALSIKEINLNRRQSNFIDSVTHELKSPIASLKLYLQTLARRPVSPQEQAEFYRFMLDDVERLDALINHVLAAGRLERTGERNSAEALDLTELLQACVAEVCARYRIPQSRIELATVPCVVLGNRLDLSLIFRNLIDNAVKYADAEAPVVRLTSDYCPGNGTAVVRISDNGPGIPHGLRSKIFGRFVRLGTELERKKPGTGLGLYIVRTLINRWKGRVHVKSGSEGGTVFEVTLINATRSRENAHADTTRRAATTAASGTHEGVQRASVVAAGHTDAATPGSQEMGE